MRPILFGIDRGGKIDETPGDLPFRPRLATIRPDGMPPPDAHDPERTRKMLCTTNGQSVLVKCKAEDGMFPHESGVLIQGVDRWYESMIDSDQVKTVDGDQKNGRLAALVVGHDQGKVLVELPRQVVAGGRRIWVPESEIVSQ